MIENPTNISILKQEISIGESKYEWHFVEEKPQIKASIQKTSQKMVDKR